MIWQAGDTVIKVIEGPNARTATLERIREVRGGVVYLGDATELDDVNAFREATGRAMVDYIPGFRSFLAALDGGEDAKIRAELVK